MNTRRLPAVERAARLLGAVFLSGAMPLGVASAQGLAGRSYPNVPWEVETGKVDPMNNVRDVSASLISGDGDWMILMLACGANGVVALAAGTASSLVQSSHVGDGFSTRIGVRFDRHTPTSGLAYVQPGKTNLFLIGHQPGRDLLEPRSIVTKMLNATLMSVEYRTSEGVAHSAFRIPSGTADVIRMVYSACKQEFSVAQ
jgi:hypothetical protein